MMTVNFTQRDLVTPVFLPPGMDVNVDNYSWNIIGGPEEAELVVTGKQEDLNQLPQLLRSGVTLLDEKGVPRWWGFVRRVEFGFEQVSFAADLDEMFNSVALAYSTPNLGEGFEPVRETTEWEEDLDSIERYGRKALMEIGSDMGSVAAQALAKRKLIETSIPRLSPSFGGSQNARIYCCGWWSTLDWKYCKIENSLALSYETIGQEEYPIPAGQKVTQSFKVVVATNLAEVGLYLKKVGGPGDLTIELCEAMDETTPGAVVRSALIPAADITTSGGWLSGQLNQNFMLSVGETYFLVLSSAAADEDNYHVLTLDPNQGYGGGKFLYYLSSGWVARAEDMPWSATWGTALFGFSGGTELQLGNYPLTESWNGVTQIFKTSTSSVAISQVGLYIRKVGNPGDLTLAIHQTTQVSTVVYHPLSTALKSATVSSNDVGTTYGWVYGLFEEPPVSLYANTYYAVVASCLDYDEDNYYEFRYYNQFESPYEERFWRKKSGTWVNLWQMGWENTNDLAFKVHNYTDTIQQTTNSGYTQLDHNINGLCQTFIQPVADKNTGVSLYVSKSGTPDDITIDIHIDQYGEIGAKVASRVIPKGNVTTTAQWVISTGVEAVTLLAGRKYYLIISAAGTDSSNVYSIYAVFGNDVYTNGELRASLVADWYHSTEAFKLHFRVMGDQGASYSTYNSTAHKLGYTWQSIAQGVYGISASSKDLNKLGAWAARVGNPGDLTLELRANNGGAPGMVLASCSIPAADVGTTFSQVKKVLRRTVTVDPTTTYWFVVSASGDESNYYEIKFDNNAGYAGGSLLVAISDEWFEHPADMPFKLYANLLIENTQQIQNIISSGGQFLRSVIANDQSGFTTGSYRNGDTTYQTEAEMLLETGTINFRRLMAFVNKDRSVDILEAEAENNSTVEMRSDGQLYWIRGDWVGPHFNPIGKWISLGRIYDLINTPLKGFREQFITRCELDGDGNLTDMEHAGWVNPAGIGVVDG